MTDDTDRAEHTVAKALYDMLDAHADHEWREVPPCVYCVPCGVRLYQGTIPAEKDPELAAKRAACQHDGGTVMYDDGEGNMREMGEGFYWICADCGYKGWYD